MQDDSGEAARGALSRVLQRWGDQFNSSKGRADLHNPLSMGERLPLLPLSRSLFAGKAVAALSNFLVHLDGLNGCDHSWKANVQIPASSQSAHTPSALAA